MITNTREKDELKIGESIGATDVTALLQRYDLNSSQASALATGVNSWQPVSMKMDRNSTRQI
jgi:hypothetical protein